MDASAPAGSPVSKAVTVSAEAAPAVAAATRPPRTQGHWEAALDAGASTCVSGSEGSLPHSSHRQPLDKHSPQQPLRQQPPQYHPMKPSDSEEDMHSVGDSSTPLASSSSPRHSSPSPEQRMQQQQKQHLQVSAAAAPPRFQAPRPSSGSDSSECPASPPSVATARATAAGPATHAHRGRSSSSSCSSMSIGAELKGLIAALGAADAVGGNELQQQLQQLLAERDLYKAAFGAAKEELKDLECRQQQLTQALQTVEHERLQGRMQQQLRQGEAEEEASRPQNRASDCKASNSSTQHPDEVSVIPSGTNCSSAEGPFPWLQQLQACVASGTYPGPDLLQKSVEQQQQLIRLAEGLQQERESYVEAVACLHSQLREAREDVSLYMSAHATHAADLTAESDEALRAADLWLQHSLRVGAKCKLWGLGSVVHSQEAAAASATRRGNAPAVRACSSSSSSTQAEAAAVAAAATLAAAEEPPPGVAVAVATAASVFGVQDDSGGDDACSSGTATGAAGGSSSTSDLERLWWGRGAEVFMEKEQLQSQHRQRERNNRLLWFLE
ncbi:hypothetical protein Efla_004355 [Eimeria flavescens]